MDLLEVIYLILDEADKNRRTGRTTRGIREAKDKGAAYVFSSWSQAHDRARELDSPEFVSTSGIGNLSRDTPLIFDHYVIEDALRAAAMRIERLEKENRELEKENKELRENPLVAVVNETVHNPEVQRFLDLFEYAFKPAVPPSKKWVEEDKKYE